MAGKVGSFFIDLVVDAASGNLSVKQLVAGLGELQVTSVATAGNLSKIAETLWNLAKAATQTAVDLTSLSATTGVDPTKLHQWDLAAERITKVKGVIVGAVESIHQMNKGIESGTVPAVLGGRLGTSQYKADGATLKQAPDYISEFAAKGSQYRKLTPIQQQADLSQIFGSNAGSVFRFIDAMSRGKAGIETMTGMDKAQAAGLDAVAGKRIETGHLMDNIFRQLLTSGGEAAGALGTLNKGLEATSKGLDTKYGKAAVGIAARVIIDSVTMRMFKPAQALKNILPQLLSQPVRVPQVPGAPANQKARVAIDLKVNGVPVGTKEVPLDGVNTGDLWRVDMQGNNTP